MRVKGDKPANTRPGFGRALARGMTRKCARCGSGNLFRYYMLMAENCPQCGLQFERLEGYWLGAVALNLIAVESLFVIVLIAMVTATWPNVPWTLILIVLVSMNVIVPLIVYPFSRTVWVAIERYLSGTAVTETRNQSDKTRSDLRGSAN